MNYLDLIGIPYELGGRGEALDCIGLALRARSRLGMPLVDPWKDIEHDYRKDQFSGTAHVAAHWQRLLPASATLGDVVLLTATREADHCGIVVDHDLVLHTSQATGSMTTRLSVLLRAGAIHSVWRP